MLHRYKRSIRNQLQLVLSLLIVCVVLSAVIFSALNLYTLDVTHLLLDDQEQIIHFDFLLNSADQAMTRYVYTGDNTNKEEYDQYIQELWNVAQELADDYSSLYVYSLKNVTEAYISEGQKIRRKEGTDNNAPILTSYSRLKSLSRTVNFFLPYARSHIAAEVSQKLGDLEKQQRSLMLYILAFFILLTFFGFAVIMHIVDRLIVTLEYLTNFAEEIGISHWNEALPAKIAQREDELGILSRTMVNMSKTIHAQMDQIQLKADLEQQYRQKEREVLESGLQLANMRLKRLQDQIQPHFLFNCLNTISKLAFIESAPRCQAATELIARYLRKILDMSVDTSTLSDEFTCVQDYCRIQEIRFGTRFSFKLSCEEICKSLRMPSICIQPLVENAFIHGLDKCARRGWIHCSAYQMDKFVYICVEDNGAGLSPERIEWIYREIANADMSLPTSKHIGLIGTVKRLEYFFGDKVELSIKSEPEVLTHICLKIPLNNSRTCNIQEGDMKKETVPNGQICHVDCL